MKLGVMIQSQGKVDGYIEINDRNRHGVEWSSHLYKT